MDRRVIALDSEIFSIGVCLYIFLYEKFFYRAMNLFNQYETCIRYAYNIQRCTSYNNCSCEENEWSCESQCAATQ